MLLRKDDAWLDELPIPDIRNWRVLDQDGNEVGFVQTIVVDRQNNAFEAVLTGANDRFGAKDIEIDEGFVRVTHALRRRTDDVRGRDEPGRDFEESFRRHFEANYAGEEWDNFLPAYRFGREMASDADFAGRSFRRAEEDLRARYVSKRARSPFESVRAAVQYGYGLARGTRSVPPGGLERGARQTVSREGVGSEQARESGSAMSNLHPNGSRP